MAAVASPIEITTPPKRYTPVGHCIYCGTYSNNLSKEHIIAHGLAGNSLILPKASCQTCAGKTRDFETICLRHMWWPFRTRIGVPTSGKQSPKDFEVLTIRTLGVTPEGQLNYKSGSAKKVDPMEFPFSYAAYKLPAPAVLCGRDPLADIECDYWGVVDKDEFKNFAPNDKDGFRLARCNPLAFCRLLAKTAHGFAVAALGEGAFVPVLRKLIRGEPSKSQEWIGGDTEIPEADPTLHDIQCEVSDVGDKSYVVVALRLFCFLGAPRYRNRGR
jgi:hypothetical protein